MSRGSRTSTTASRRVFAILGDPVAHSLSPAMHAASFAALGIAAVYGAIRCDAAGLPVLMRAIARHGGGNVTVPHKAAALAALDEATAVARIVGAANTFWGEDGRVLGDNTDVAGVLAAVGDLGVPPGGWMVAGTGGSARAVIAAAVVAGAPVAVRSRDPRRAAAFSEWAGSLGVAAATGDECVLCINATPLGIRADDPLPIAPDAVPRAVAALDLVYAAGCTPWVRAWRARGLAASDGRAMLVEQGRAAECFWFPDANPSSQVMRAAVDAALA